MEKDYFKMFNHLRLIMEQVKKEKSLENYVLREIFNSEMKDKTDEEIYNMKVYSALFENRISEMERLNKNSKKEFVDMLYDCYFDKGMIRNYSNGNIDAAKAFYKAFDERVKEFSGYNEIQDFINVNHQRKIM